MTDHHKITERELDGWLRRENWQQFARSVGNGSDKSFEIDAGVCRVKDHGKTIFLGAHRRKAIEAYNAAR